MKKSDKIAGICFLVASICYFICAIIGIFSKDTMAVTNLCLGACFFCLSSVYLNKKFNYKKKKRREYNGTKI